MLLTHYYALAGAGVLLAAAWLMVPRARVEVTSFLSLLVWLLLGLVGNQTETVVQNETVTTVNNTTLAVSSPEFVAAPLPESMRWFAAFMAILSALALYLSIYDQYPQEDMKNE